MTSDTELIIHNLFEDSARRYPEKTCIQIKHGDAWRRITYADARRDALKTARFLRDEGAGAGEAAVLISENCPEWIIIYLGMMYAGVVCVPIDAQAGGDELESCAADCGARIMFCSEEILARKVSPRLKEKLARIVVIAEGDAADGRCVSFLRVLAGTAPQSVDGWAAPDDTALLIYTSGTTARPKGVMLSHKNICSNFKSIEALRLCAPSDNFLALLPFHHTYPLMVTVIVPLSYGAVITCAPPGFKPQDLHTAIREACVTIVVGVPQLFTLLHAALSARIDKIPRIARAAALPLIRRAVRASFAGVRVFLSGGARLDPAVARRLSMWGLKVIEGYGLSESSPVVTFNPPRRVKFCSVGKVIPGVQVKILNPDTRGEGEILVRGGNVMKGYYKDEKLTVETIRNGWLHTGDVGYLDRDGYLFITGRLKEVIVLPSGKNIYPEEIEICYGQSPYIKEMCIVGRPLRAPVAGESLFAVIRPDLEYFRQKSEANIAQKIRWELDNLGRHLPPYKHIMGFMLVKEELPRTILKKLRRYEVKRRYLDQDIMRRQPEALVLSVEDRELLSRQTSRRIVSYISGRVKKAVTPDSHLEIDLGIDSLTRVEIGLGLEEMLKLHISDDVLYSVATVRDVLIKVGEISAGVQAQPAGPEGTESRASWKELLKISPPQGFRDKIRLEMTAADIFLNACAQFVFACVMNICWFLRVRSRAHLPSEGPFLICPNHASYLDGFAIYCALPFKTLMNTYFLGYSRIFEYPLFRWAIKPGRLIPIDPASDLISALQAVSWALARKKAVCIFPEGERAISEELEEFRKGVGIIIKELGIPVVPAYIKGSHRSWPRTQRLPNIFRPVKVIFGPLRTAQELQAEGDTYEMIAQKLRREVENLEKPDVRPSG